MPLLRPMLQHDAQSLLPGRLPMRREAVERGRLPGAAAPTPELDAPSVSAFFAKHGATFESDTFAPVCELYFDADDIGMRCYRCARSYCRCIACGIGRAVVRPTTTGVPVHRRSHVPTHSPSAGHRRQARSLRRRNLRRRLLVSLGSRAALCPPRAHAATDELLAAAAACARNDWRVYVGAERARTYRRALACFSARNAKCRAVERHPSGTFHS